MAELLQKGFLTNELAKSYSLTAQVQKNKYSVHSLHWQDQALDSCKGKRLKLEVENSGLYEPASGSSFSTPEACRCGGERSLQLWHQRRSEIESLLSCSQLYDLCKPQVSHL